MHGLYLKGFGIFFISDKRCWSFSQQSKEISMKRSNFCSGMIISWVRHSLPFNSFPCGLHLSNIKPSKTLFLRFNSRKLNAHLHPRRSGRDLSVMMPAKVWYPWIISEANLKSLLCGADNINKHPISSICKNEDLRTSINGQNLRLILGRTRGRSDLKSLDLGFPMILNHLGSHIRGKQMRP